MTHINRRPRRPASAHADGRFCVAVPPGAELDDWMREAREVADAESRALLLAIAHLARRAMIRDGKRAGDRFWVSEQELADAANRLGAAL